MRVALCSTTINVPHVLKLYRACDPDVKFFVAGDEKTPHAEINDLLDKEPLGSYLHPDHQERLGYKCSQLIGWNSIQRRNIAFLEALKWGADIIVSCDDDNTPLSQSYFDDFANHFAYADKPGPNYNRATGMHVLMDTPRPFNGLMANNVNLEDDWFDVGSLLQPNAKHRGLPNGYAPARNNFTHVTGAKVGVSAGICLGDPDVDAVTRIAQAPDVHQVSQTLEAGVVNNPHSWTVFNSQNTAVLRELIPAWGMVPFCGRMDDIYASLIVQRIMRERDLHVYFGRPFVHQQRNEHNLIKDLRGELDGYECVARLADLLDHVQLAGKSVIADCRRIWETLNQADWMPGRSVSAMCAYLDDCEAVL